MSGAELFAQLLVAGSGSSALAIACTAFLNRHKSKADVQAAVNTLARDWLDMANAQLKALEAAKARQDEEIGQLRGQVFGMRDLVVDVLDQLDRHQDVAGFRARFERIGLG